MHTAIPDDSADRSSAWLPGPRCERTALGHGALDGVRLGVKDLIDVGGDVTGGGNPDWAASHGPAARDAHCVGALRRAGARVAGKTISDELAFSLEGENAHYGTPRHPIDPGRLPGGSSGGSAAAVAWGEADLALGTDTGGSVRVPASFCGVHAMRPTHGRIPLAGVLPFAPSYDTVGWFARDASLLRDAGQALLSRSKAGSRAPLSLCVAVDALALAEPPVREALSGFARRLGIDAERSVYGDGDWHDWLNAYAVLQGLEIRAHLGPWIRRQRPRFGPALAPRFDAALALDVGLRPYWTDWRANAARRLTRELGADEAWLVPAAPCPALLRNADANRRDAFYEKALALGAVAGHAGLPQVVMPLATVEGLPLGVSFISARGNDERLLDLAVTLSAATGARP
ncbi:MAG: amidase [Burkholderiaceae bacterium]